MDLLWISLFHMDFTHTHTISQVVRRDNKRKRPRKVKMKPWHCRRQESKRAKVLQMNEVLGARLTVLFDSTSPHSKGL